MSAISKKSFRKKLEALATLEYKKFTAALNPGIDNLLGVRLPLLRELAKEIYASNWQSYVTDTDIKYTEELMLDAMLICKADFDLNLIKNFIPKINGWAVCDTFCCGLKIRKQNKETFLKFISPYINSKKEYDVRFCAVSLLAIFNTEEETETALKILNRARHSGYYAKMGVAWAVSVFFISNKNKVLDFLKSNELDDFTHNKAIQKICDSFRVSDKDKNAVRKLKRK